MDVTVASNLGADAQHSDKQDCSAAATACCDRWWRLGGDDGVGARDALLGAISRSVVEWGKSRHAGRCNSLPVCLVILRCYKPQITRHILIFPSGWVGHVVSACNTARVIYLRQLQPLVSQSHQGCTAQLSCCPCGAHVSGQPSHTCIWFNHHSIHPCCQPGQSSSKHQPVI